jgi:hypothetical protein
MSPDRSIDNGVKRHLAVLTKKSPALGPGFSENREPARAGFGGRVRTAPDPKTQLAPAAMVPRPAPGRHIFPASMRPKRTSESEFPSFSHDVTPWKGTRRRPSHKPSGFQKRNAKKGFLNLLRAILLGDEARPRWILPKLGRLPPSTQP